MEDLENQHGMGMRIPIAGIDLFLYSWALDGEGHITAVSFIKIEPNGEETITSYNYTPDVTMEIMQAAAAIEAKQSEHICKACGGQGRVVKRRFMSRSKYRLVICPTCEGTGVNEGYASPFTFATRGHDKNKSNRYWRDRPYEP